MSVARDKLIAALTPKIPPEILTTMLDEYHDIKQQFFLGKFQPSELNAARFTECVLRLLEFLHTRNYTPFGKELKSDNIIKSIENNTALQDTLRLFIPRLIRVILDVRNKRDVAHVGGEVSPNYSDAIFVVHSTDWILTEIVRHFYNCPIKEAREIIKSINETQIPVIAEVDGFVRVQNTKLETPKKALLILYYKQPIKVSDSDLFKWTKYGNSSRFKTEILKKLDEDALIHYINGSCTLLPKGIAYVEKNIPLDLLV